MSGDEPGEITVLERRVLLRAGKLVERYDGWVYVDSGQFQARCDQAVVAALIARGLLVRVGDRFQRTPAGTLALVRSYDRRG